MFLYVIYFVAFNYRDDFFNYKMIFLRLSFTFFFLVLLLILRMGKRTAE